ncbi:MAG: peroxiredoxin family protein [Bacteroidia bacterium]|nr:peroxiredoxin family protein [Bacteroidia bacterium]
MEKKYFLLIFFAFLIMSAGYGQEINFARFGIETKDSHIPQGLKVGDMAPGFTGYDQKGTQVELKKLLEKGPLVLFFYRGKWCPVCSRYLNNYQDSLKIITDQGFNVVAITPESIENVEQTVKVHNISFTVIYDCQEKIMKDYDVMFNVTKAYQDKIFNSLSTDIAKNNGRDAARLPVPATYIISKEGIIVAVQFDPDYKIRASVKWILQNLGKAF